MPSKKRPKFDEVLDGIRVRVYATRSEHQVIFNDEDIDDVNSTVLCYPKVGTADMWARQGRAEYRPETTST